MTNQELIAKYNPANVRNLSNEDIAAMRNLTTEQLKVLAEAYPNGPRNRAYLVLHDSNVAEDRQIGTLSTWPNLYNVRKFSNMKNLSALTFRELYSRTPARRATANVSSGNANLKGMSARKVIDLSAGEAAAELQQNAAAAAAKQQATTDPGATGTEIAPPAKLNDIKGQQASKSAKASVVKTPSAVTKRSSGMKAVKQEPAQPAEQNPPADQDFGDPGGDDVTDTNVGDTGQTDGGQ